MSFKHLNMWNDILSTLYPSSEPRWFYPSTCNNLGDWMGNDILSTSTFSTWIEPPVVFIDPHLTNCVTEWDGNDILSSSTLFLSTEPTRSVVPLWPTSNRGWTCSHFGGVWRSSSAKESWARIHACESNCVASFVANWSDE